MTGTSVGGVNCNCWQKPLGNKGKLNVVCINHCVVNHCVVNYVGSRNVEWSQVNLRPRIRNLKEVRHEHFYKQECIG